MERRGEKKTQLFPMFRPLFTEHYTRHMQSITLLRCCGADYTSFFSEITPWTDSHDTPAVLCGKKKKRMSTVGSDVKHPQTRQKNLLFQFTYQLKDTEAAPAAII